MPICLKSYGENINAPQRLKTFIWVVMHDALPTNHARFRRGFTSQDACILRDNSLEATLRALCDCTYMKHLWKGIGHSFITNSCFLQPLLKWLDKILLNETRCNLGTS